MKAKKVIGVICAIIILIVALFFPFAQALLLLHTSLRVAVFTEAIYLSAVLVVSGLVWGIIKGLFE